MTQNDLILDLLRRGPLTPLEALEQAGSLRLAARVADLRAAGHDIETTTAVFGTKHVARYVLHEEPQRELGL